MVIHKPIIHLTSKTPMAVDLEVHISEGRPWFAYPCPTILRLEIHPRRARHWELRAQEPWMAPPPIPNSPKYDWSRAIREVPSSWIGQRGETERFLYYDGPTRAAAPVNVEFESTGSRLRFTRPYLPSGDLESQMYPRHPFQPMSPTPRNDLPAHEGLYIQVRSGALLGQYIPVDDHPTAQLEPNLPLRGDAVVARFRKMLVDYGLTGPEAEGLVRAWTPQVFQTEGRRFILRISPEEYAKQCPIQVRPTPTEMVRLGLVLSEFDARLGPARDEPKAGN